MEDVASSEVGEDVRELPIPAAALNHWDEVDAGGEVGGFWSTFLRGVVRRRRTRRSKKVGSADP